MPTTLRLTIVPGINGSDESHWQTLWQAASADAVRIAPASWDDPDLADWVAAVEAAVTTPDTILVAHSLGCLAAAAWLAGNPGRVRGALLVAPPDRFGPAFPPVAPSFRSAKPAPLGVPALVVASDNDPFCSLATARALAAGWGADLAEAGSLGHINNASRLGDWPDGRALLAAFETSLKVIR